MASALLQTMWELHVKQNLVLFKYYQGGNIMKPPQIVVSINSTHKKYSFTPTKKGNVQSVE